MQTGGNTRVCPHLDVSLTSCANTMVDIDAHACLQLTRGNRADLQCLFCAVDMAAEVAHCTTGGTMHWEHTLFLAVPIHTIPATPSIHSHSLHCPADSSPSLTFARHPLPDLALHEWSAVIALHWNIKWADNHLVGSSSSTALLQHKGWAHMQSHTVHIVCTVQTKILCPSSWVQLEGTLRWNMYVILKLNKHFWVVLLPHSITQSPNVHSTANLSTQASC